MFAEQTDKATCNFFDKNLSKRTNDKGKQKLILFSQTPFFTDFLLLQI